MNLIDKIQDFAQTAVGTTRSKVDALQDGRRRAALIKELGELTYRRHRGDPVDDTAIAPILAELDGIEADEADEADAADDAQADEPEGGDTV